MEWVQVGTLRIYGIYFEFIRFQFNHGKYTLWVCLSFWIISLLLFRLILFLKSVVYHLCFCAKHHHRHHGSNDSIEWTHTHKLFNCNCVYFNFNYGILNFIKFMIKCDCFHWIHCEKKINIETYIEIIHILHILCKVNEPIPNSIGVCVCLLERARNFKRRNARQ